MQVHRHVEVVTYFIGPSIRTKMESGRKSQSCSWRIQQLRVCAWAFHGDLVERPLTHVTEISRTEVLHAAIHPKCGKVDKDRQEAQEGRAFAAN